ncbi:MAG: hypothetical protein BWY17_05394 [Deltaproteobacteria bacterium ADurb.Bin207]|nr:MAG: hypothetical protein BWY17_05394 [Deltaproteobacteria bacterium ADurb.Bin207]
MQTEGRFVGRDIARDHLHLGIQALDLGYTIDHVFGVAVRGVHDDGIDPGGDQRANAFHRIIGSSNGSGHHQPTFRVP